jgi:hypothetical protein
MRSLNYRSCTLKELSEELYNFALEGRDKELSCSLRAKENREVIMTRGR